MIRAGIMALCSIFFTLSNYFLSLLPSRVLKVTFDYAKICSDCAWLYQSISYIVPSVRISKYEPKM